MYYVVTFLGVFDPPPLPCPFYLFSVLNLCKYVTFLTPPPYKWLRNIFCFVASSGRRLRTKCQIPNFIVWIFVFVAIQKKKRQQSLFSFRITTSTKNVVCHIWYFAFVFSKYMMQWNKHINFTKSHVDSLFAYVHLRHKVHTIRLHYYN